MRGLLLTVCVAATLVVDASAADIKTTPLYARIKASIDAVPAIDTHDHLRPFDQIPNQDDTDRGRGVTLHSIFASSYYPQIKSVRPWPSGKSFDTWWSTARRDFDDSRATSFYRYLLPAFRDLYGVDFDTMTDQQAHDLNDKIFANYKDDKWLVDVVTRRANIELMFIDPYWARLRFERAYQFSVQVLNVTMLISGSHASRFASPLDSPYVYAQRSGKKIESLDDYVAVIETIFADAVAADAVCLKSTQAYQRTLRYENVSKERAAAVFGRPESEVSAAQQRDFEDFMFWRIVKLSEKYDLPFQIHTGHGCKRRSSSAALGG